MLSTGQWNAFNRTLGQKPAANRWLGWRLRVLVGSVLVACVGLFWLAFWLSQQPYLGSTWRSTPTGQIELSQTHLRELLPAQGKVLVEVLADGQTTPVRLGLVPTSIEAEEIVVQSEAPTISRGSAQTSASLDDDLLRIAPQPRRHWNTSSP